MTSVLVSYGSKMGGTAEIAGRIASTLEQVDLQVTLQSAAELERFDQFDAIVLGSAIYTGRWRKESLRLLQRIEPNTPEMPLWIFHSGPLGDDQDDEVQSLPRKAADLVGRLDIRDVKAFGGRLPEDPPGWLAGAMAKKNAGDWRDFDDVEAWAGRIGSDLDSAVDRG